MKTHTLFVCAALCAASILPTFASQHSSPPTQADQRFKAKYGILPPHITADEREEQRRSRRVEKAKRAKDPKVKAERDRQ